MTTVIMFIPSALSIFLLAAIFSRASGCECATEPAFCSVGFGIRGTVTGIRGNVTAGDLITYTVRIAEVYRNSTDGISVDNSVDIITISSAKACGIPDLQENVTYLLSGGVVFGSYHLHTCNSVVVEYSDYVDNKDRHEDVDIPCSATLSSMTVSAFVVVFVALLDHVFFP
ncbi:uncharacterized protein LOC121413117 [Lytechinus variegatus]|uniref:uncharacterized protein LOC121413117 n=1 Tax=Lytechinus variegatus TaxID=7654 RepID=UPI001BB24EED|nr:uncharacterized protein LOC121413117 [Lytechinus variegatus]